MAEEQGKKHFGIKDIAKLAGVSIATVDRVLNNRKDVSDSTREKVLAIIKENNYQPNLFARSLSVKNNLNVAVLIPKTSFQTGYWQLCLDGINKGKEELEPFGIHTHIFLYDQEKRATFKKAAAEVLKQNFSAVVIAPIFEKETQEFVSDCHKRKMQTVYINSDIPSKSTLGYIGPDLYSTGRLAGNLTSYLVQPHAKILVLNVAKGLENYRYLETKIEGFQEYLGQVDPTIKIDIVDIPYNEYEQIELELKASIKRYNPDLIFFTNSRVAVLGRFYTEHPRMKKPKIIGFDFLGSNVDYLASGVVDFLICQRPDKQGYFALNYLYRYFLKRESFEGYKPMPIDILTKENYLFYEN
ncbi:LacI family DNA-binding transcriptional regulator [Sphingobacterium humi]|uniref:Substrate-binding domain-containing protein n=1 Tax=Sphingobacterium humi TaxID=1796905 RepID=A0A6N8KWY2_9SPHI|nr:LacI family DNA-binding transcriptional regulator [Sphingobacterium humi]MVZ61915.1 substrate-binding domain-containing protein [Sphingobacterium humi]